MPGRWALRCGACGDELPVEGFAWRCACGGLLDLVAPDDLDPTPPAGAPWSLWRYAGALPPLAAAGAASVTMGEGMTPLVEEGGALLKLDMLMPTLSFKDRGAAVLVAALAAAGVRQVVADSSGNAGTAVAAYCTRAGIAAEVHVPAATSPAKRAAIGRLGARVVVVDGDRAATAAAARARVEATGATYASHVHQPLFTQGTKTFAYECAEQLGAAPGTVVVPAGNGTLALGAAIGFADLVAAGRIAAAPRLVVVQAARCAPLAGRHPDGPTVAEGIAIAEPPRGAQVLRAVAASGGEVLLAEEGAIAPARAELARRGIDVEPTAAATWAAWRAWPGARSAPGPVVLALCGAGLKSPG